MNEDVNQPEQASPAGADAPNEFAVYGDEEPPVPYLPLPSESPQQLAEQTSPAPVTDSRATDTPSSSKAGEPATLAPSNAIKVLRGIILVLVIASGIFCIGLAYDGYWMRFGITTQGTIVNATSLYCSGGKNSSYSYSYEVQFTDNTGQVQVVDLDGCGSQIGDVFVGDSITIIYLPSDPTGIKLKEDLILNFEFIAFMAAIPSSMLVVLMLALLPRKRRIRRNKSLSTNYHN